MSLSGTKCTRLVLILCNVLFSWISGGLLVVFGGACLYEPSYVQMHTLLTIDKVPQYVFILFALTIIALGGFIITLGLFGCFGTLCDNNCIIKTYIYLLIFVFVGEIGLAVGSLYLYFTFPTLAHDIKDNLVDKLQTDFGFPHHHTFNTALEFSQTTMQCCGLNNYTDYDQSSWHSMAPNHNLRVPFSCCATSPISLASFPIANFTDENSNLVNDEVTEAALSSSSTEPSWWKQCQSLNPMESDDYLYAQGCWDHIYEIYMRHALFSGILFASLALLQMLGVIFPICWLRRVEHKSSQIRIRTRQAQPLL